MAGSLALRRPEYTGANRCWPCTLANLGLLVAVSVTIGLVRPAAAVAVAVLGCGVIWSRGYLVPYTPSFAPRMLALLPVGGRRSGHGRSTLDPRADGERDAVDGEQVLETLTEAGAVEVDRDGLVLADGFRRRWHESMEELAGLGTEELASAALGASAAAASVEAIEGTDGTFVVLSDGSGNVSWLHRPVAIAETAAAEVLASLGVPRDQRDLAAHATCAFLERCPACNDEVVETSAGGCCGGTVPSPTVDSPQVLACRTCDVHFFTLESA